MINEAKQILEDVLRHNYAMRRIREGEEDIQHREEYWREDERIKKAKEKAEERTENLKWTLV